uniref:Uncharacterized LOC107305758 n=1 Tax=Coturnix japonica TaxID=93934 RepID=A0A8C2T106_COTJA
MIAPADLWQTDLSPSCSFESLEGPFLSADIVLLLSVPSCCFMPQLNPFPPLPEMCQRPRWDPELHLAPDLQEYKKNEEVMLSCPEGLQPSYTHIRCSREVQNIIRGKPVYREVWLGRASSGSWIRIRSRVECVEVLEVVPGTVDVTSTTIKLNWTCSFPDACQHIQATCRLAGPSSPPCEAEELTGAEILHGKMGTFTCPPLQPFTDYTVTISVPPSTVLFSWVIRTKEAGGCPWNTMEGTFLGCFTSGEADNRVHGPAAPSEHPYPAVMVLALGLHAACGAVQKGLCKSYSRALSFLPSASSPPHCCSRCCEIHTPLVAQTVLRFAVQPDPEQKLRPSMISLCVTPSSCASSAAEAGAAAAGCQQWDSQVEGAALLPRGDRWVPAEHHGQGPAGRRLRADRAAAAEQPNHGAPAARVRPRHQIRGGRAGPHGCGSRSCSAAGLSHQRLR